MEKKISFNKWHQLRKKEVVNCTSLADIYRHYSLPSWRISSYRRFYQKSDSFIDTLQDEQWAPSTSLGYRRAFNRRLFLRLLTRNSLWDSQRSIEAVDLGSSMTLLQMWTASSGTCGHSADDERCEQHPGFSENTISRCKSDFTHCTNS